MATQVPCSCHSPASTFFANSFKLKKQAKFTSKMFGETTSIMYKGGTIRTLEGGSADAVVEAIGFHAGKVVAVGSSENVADQMSKLTRGNYDTVTLSKKQALYPGFIEPHCHTGVSGCMLGGMTDFSPFSGQSLRERYDVDWFADTIRDAAQSVKPGYWILGHSSDPALMPYELVEDGLNKLQVLNVETMDTMESEIPVLVLTTGHSAFVNTPTLRIVYEKLQPEQFKTFEEFYDYVNRRQGLNEWPEVLPAMSCIPEAQLDEIANSSVKGLNIMFDTLVRRGVTTVNDAGMIPDTLTVMQDYFKDNPPRVRVGYAMVVNNVEEICAFPEYSPMTHLPKFYQAFIKIVADGSNQCLTGFQKSPYLCYPENNTGISNFDDQLLTDMLKTAIKVKKWPVLVHSNGDAQVERSLNAYEKALAGESGLEKRHRIEHCSLLSDESIDKMARLGISPSFLIGHVAFWGDVFKNAVFGEEKVQLLDRCQSALQKGIRISLHSDFWVTPFGPLRKMEQAITRIIERDPDTVLNRDEQITPAQALRAVTYDAAWQCQIDKFVGSLEVGKHADYVILAEDPLARTDFRNLRDIPVLETWMDGVKRGSWVYQ